MAPSAELSTMSSLDVAPLPLPSASTISATATRWVHVIKLSGYSHAKRLLGTGECVKSAVFQAAGHSWRVQVYPNGAREECVPGSIALFLELVGEPKGDVRVELQFSLLRHGTRLASAHDGGGKRTEPPVTLNADVRGWGFEDVGTERELEKPEYVEDDTILIRCDITVANELVVGCNDAHLLASSRKKKKKKKKKKKGSKSCVMAQDPPPPSASTIAVTASTGCHVVKVSGYSRTNLLPGNGKQIKSAVFKEAGHAWRIWCSPDGDNEETTGHVSLYLELAGETTDVHTEFQFSLVPPQHGHLAPEPIGGEARSGRVTFGSKLADSCFGYKDFMAREELERSEYLKDDCFYIRCDIAAMNKPVAKLHDADALGLLCYCTDDLCDKIHGGDKVEADAPGEPGRFPGMLLSCFPIRSKPSRRHIEYSRL